MWCPSVGSLQTAKEQIALVVRTQQGKSISVCIPLWLRHLGSLYTDRLYQHQRMYFNRHFNMSVWQGLPSGKLPVVSRHQTADSTACHGLPTIQVTGLCQHSVGPQQPDESAWPDLLARERPEPS